MEVYLLKEEVKILKVGEAFSKTNKYNGYIKELEQDEHDDSCGNCQGANCNSNDAVDHTILTLSDLPVALSSVCTDSDVNEHSEQFAKRVKMKLTRNEKILGWHHLKLRLIIDDNDPSKLDGYFLLSDKFRDPSVFDVLLQLEQELGIAEVDFSVQVSLCHLPTKNTPVSPESLVCLKSEHEDIYYCLFHKRVCSNKPVQVPRQMDLLGKRTGFIYSKISVKATLKAKAVDLVYGYLDGNMRLLKDGAFTDLEIGCKNGEIVKCHRAFLVDKSDVLHDKLKDMLEREGQAVPWKLEMDMSKNGVEAFLEYIYCGNVSKGVSGCESAMELLMAARKYKVVGLENAMEEIIMAKGSSEFGYFSVKNALDLFVYARNVVGRKHLRDKAVRVLQNYLKTASDKLVGSKEYQALFINQPQVAIELSSLYYQLS